MTSTDTRHAYAPLFDDSELVLIGCVPVRTSTVLLPKAVQNASAFERRLIHDRQFVDLSERYDPIEATVDAGKSGPVLDAGMKAALAGVWLSGVLFAVAAWVA